jgi:D-aminopeptidase
LRDSLLIAGAPVGQHLRNDRIYSAEDGAAADTGSIIIVIGTDAPLLPHQLERISRRAGMGLARMGSSAGNGSGDLFVAFSTANQAALAGAGHGGLQATFLANDQMDPLFVATVQATEEAITNALIAARDMQGTEGHYAKAIDHEALIAVLKRYGRLAERH